MSASICPSCGGSLAPGTIGKCPFCGTYVTGTPPQVADSIQPPSVESAVLLDAGSAREAYNIITNTYPRVIQDIQALGRQIAAGRKLAPAHVEQTIRPLRIPMETLCAQFRAAGISVPAIPSLLDPKYMDQAGQMDEFAFREFVGDLAKFVQEYLLEGELEYHKYRAQYLKTGIKPKVIRQLIVPIGSICLGIATGILFIWLAANLDEKQKPYKLALFSALAMLAVSSWPFLKLYLKRCTQCGGLMTMIDLGSRITQSDTVTVETVEREGVYATPALGDVFGVPKKLGYIERKGLGLEVVHRGFRKSRCIACGHEERQEFVRR